MIDRYSITAPAARIIERFHVEVLDNYSPHYNAAPTHLLPVITLDSPQGTSTFYWGTLPQWSNNKTLGEKIINIQAETIPDKGSLRKSLMKSRCIVPADGFYAWKKVGKRTSIPYRFVATTQELFSLAGFWEEFEDDNSHLVCTFKLITVPSNGLVASIHDRMPVLFRPQAEKIWLDRDSSELQLLDLLKAYPSAEMNYYPVTPRIADAHVNLPSMLLPTQPADQFGNLTLFD
jgi:putative SOS response-associated peptidase YedK